MSGSDHKILNCGMIMKSVEGKIKSSTNPQTNELKDQQKCQKMQTMHKKKINLKRDGSDLSRLEVS